jgi:uncharacterized small protein (DUF1192 family)
MHLPDGLREPAADQDLGPRTHGGGRDDLLSRLIPEEEIASTVAALTARIADLEAQLARRQAAPARLQFLS